MPVTTTKSPPPNTVPTTVLLRGSTVYGDRRHNNTSRTTPMTMTVAANDTGFNSSKPPEPVAGGYGAPMVLVPFGIITVIGLAVVMILYIRKRNRLEKLRLQLMPMYSFDPAEEQAELESEVLEQSREAAAAGAELKTLTTTLGNTENPG
ncbi:uncharacterized protein C3orf18 homolog isoform X1 [Brienomyrus brachyistius]|uniref:uncharacterized protein C3orf18 homolog isoform X1 n=1 Tax=Brienomyrus brachyistius TaxID=42636 RepID=UPI0020B44E61|nr:uncharacterized protein C3orf18 homolog isoform X1 [Brienomyrus brachyistius]